VTRLGEFSPIGRLFILSSFCKIAEVTRILGLLFSTVQVMYYKKNLDQCLYWSFATHKQCILHKSKTHNSIAMYVLIFYKKWVGLYFGRLLKRLIWSPWSQRKLDAHFFELWSCTYVRANKGSMLGSQFSAIFANFGRKNRRFSQNPMLWQKTCII
jgi:hypothetical protein